MMQLNDSSKKHQHLQQAVEEYDTEKIRYFVQSSTEKDDNTIELLTKVLFIACGRGDTDMVTWTLEQGVDASACTLVHKTSPLHLAAARGDHITCQILLQHGANVNVSINKSITPLMKAVRAGHEETVKVLLARDDIDVNLGDSLRGTSLNAAIEQGHENIMNLLLEHGTNLNIVDSRGRGAVFHATMRRLPDMIRKLVAAGCSPDTPDRKGQYPIHVACRRGYLDIVSVLIDCGCDVNILAGQKEWHTPLSEAIVNGHYKIIEKLFEAGAIPDFIQPDASWGAIASFFISNRCNHDILRLLIRNGCDTNFKMRATGYSVLHCVFDKAWYSAASIIFLADCDPQSEPWLTGVLSSSAEDGMLADTGTDIISRQRPAAQLSRAEIEHVLFLNLVKQQMGQPLCLKQLCRISIKCRLLRRLPYVQSVRELHLPHLLERYLLYEL